MTLDTVIDLGQTLAVFASLLFVGYQIRQHTRAPRRNPCGGNGYSR